MKLIFFSLIFLSPFFSFAVQLPVKCLSKAKTLTEMASGYETAIYMEASKVKQTGESSFIVYWSPNEDVRGLVWLNYNTKLDRCFVQRVDVQYRRSY